MPLPIMQRCLMGPRGARGTLQIRFRLSGASERLAGASSIRVGLLRTLHYSESSSAPVQRSLTSVEEKEEGGRKSQRIDGDSEKRGVFIKTWNVLVHLSAAVDPACL